MNSLAKMLTNKGWEIARKRATKKHPDLAFRAALRKRGGSADTIAISNEDLGLTLDSWFEDGETERQYLPWWANATLHSHWWLSAHGPRTQWRNLKAYHHRGKKGFDRSDTWSLDSYLSRLIRDSMLHLRDHNHGWPGPGEGLTCIEDWHQVMTDVADGMDAHLTLLNEHVYPNDPRYDELIAQRDRAFDLMKQWWGGFWD